MHSSVSLGPASPAPLGRALMPQGHVWKIVENLKALRAVIGWPWGGVSLETNARSQNALPSGMPLTKP